MRSSMPSTTRGSTHGSSTLSSRILTRPNRYSFESVIAQGRTGTLYRAYDEQLDQRVVLKLLNPEKFDSDDARERFEHGARVLTEVDHSNIVRVHDFGYHHGIAFLAMEWVEGITLEDYLEERAPLPLDQFAPLADAILAGLTEAHEREITHGDLQASHVTLQSGGGQIRRVALNGFGFPELASHEGDSASERIRNAKAIGAVAPERILGKDADHRVDLYAFGVLAYRMLAGRPPFEGRELAIFYQHVHDEPPLLSSVVPEEHEIPRTMVEFIHRLLAKKPTERPRDARQAREWLRSTVKQTAIFDLDETPVPAADRAADQVDSSPTKVTAARPDWAKAPPDASFPSVFADDDRATLGRVSEWSVPSWIVAGVIGAGLIAGMWLVVQETRETNERSTALGTAERAASSDTHAGSSYRDVARDRIENVFDRVQSALRENRYETAKSLLASIRGDLTAHPKLLAKAASLSSRAEVGRTLQRAKKYDNRLEIEKAIETYQKVLSLQSKHRTARERLDTLTSSVVLTVGANVEGTVVLDGKRLGSTPLQKLVPADFETVSVRSDGYRTWRHRRTSASTRGGERVELHAELEPRRGSGTNGEPGLARPRTGEGNSTLGDDSLMEME